ncbi:MAG: PLP-dependent aminotransferase family protein [Lachnospiraceae bacterium]|nr:PLP-dependent aminotransferase family protein [Lachnospiraceae bacterium]
MPFNSFENYPMTWKLDRERLKPPLYISIANALEEDIKNGILTPNTKLPPQRELADYLDVNLSTITRAFKICEMKGLLYATVGKGTYVSSIASMPLPYRASLQDKQYIDFSQIRPFYEFNEVVAEVARSIMLRPNANTLFEYNYSVEGSRYELAGQKWLNQYHMNVPLDNILITSGTQNALVISLQSFFSAGDKIAIDSYSYPNFIGLANLLNIQLVAIENDECGMIPESLEMNCKINGIKGIYLVPSCNNPTAITMPQCRRDKIAKIILNNQLLLIEDDTYAFLAPNLYPISCSVPEQFIYISGTSKALCAGLRVAFVAFSDKLKTEIIRGMQSVNLKTPLLNLEIITEMIESNIATQLVSQRIQLSRERNSIYQKYFTTPSCCNPLSFFQWLPLPKGCNGYNFELQAKKSGLLLFCSERFTVGPPRENTAIRISMCSVKNNTELETGLKIIQKLINENIFPEPMNTFIV